MLRWDAMIVVKIILFVDYLMGNVGLFLLLLCS